MNNFSRKKMKEQINRHQISSFQNHVKGFSHKKTNFQEIHQNTFYLSSVMYGKKIQQSQKQLKNRPEFFLSMTYLFLQLEILKNCCLKPQMEDQQCLEQKIPQQPQIVSDQYLYNQYNNKQQSTMKKGVSLSDVTNFVNLFVVQNPARSVNQNFSNGGQHDWSGQRIHHTSGGRGTFGTYWECKNPNCKYHDQASRYNTIAQSPPCSTRCTKCGDWQYNCRETCPSAPSQGQSSSAPENIYRYHCEQENGWRFMYSSRDNDGNGWEIDGISFKAPLHGTGGAVPVFQYHYDQSSTYGGWRFLYSTNSTHENEGWTLDGVKFFAFGSQMPGTVPIYQHRVMQSDGARFLLSQSSHCEGWDQQQIAFWAYPGDVK